MQCLASRWARSKPLLPIAAGNGLHIGILALQGAFAAHANALERLGQTTVEVRQPQHLAGIDGLVIPGGESTTMSMMLDRTELRDPIAALLADGLPAFGTCAGAIMLATTVLDARPDQSSFGVLDISIRRNAYGRQRDSFEAVLAVSGLDRPIDVPFIRAPRIERTGESVDILAVDREHPVLVATGSVVAATFHPELTADDQIHALWLARMSGER